MPCKRLTPAFAHVCTNIPVARIVTTTSLEIGGSHWRRFGQLLTTCGGDLSIKSSRRVPTISPINLRLLWILPGNCPCISRNRGEWHRTQEPADHTSGPGIAPSVVIRFSFRPEGRSLKSTLGPHGSLLCHTHHMKFSPYEFSRAWTDTHVRQRRAYLR
jgi:hypothetical protein